jgi:hypothetical protein
MGRGNNGQNRSKVKSSSINTIPVRERRPRVGVKVIQYWPNANTRSVRARQINGRRNKRYKNAPTSRNTPWLEGRSPSTHQNKCLKPPQHRTELPPSMSPQPASGRSTGRPYAHAPNHVQERESSSTVPNPPNRHVVGWGTPHNANNNVWRRPQVNPPQSIMPPLGRKAHAPRLGNQPLGIWRG